MGSDTGVFRRSSSSLESGREGTVNAVGAPVG